MQKDTSNIKKDYANPRKQFGKKKKASRCSAKIPSNDKHRACIWARITKCTKQDAKLVMKQLC